jgi:hypothetical protein
MNPIRTALFAGLAIAAPALADDLYALAGNVSPILFKLDPATGGSLESHSVTGQEALFGGLGTDTAGNLYSIDGYNDNLSDRLFSINRTTGAGAVVGETRFNWNFRCLTLNPATGTLIGSTDNRLFSMNTTRGVATLIADITEPGNPHLDQMTAIAINAAGQAFGTDIQGTDLFSVNLQTGIATWIGSVGGDGNWFNDLAFDSAGVLHGARFNGGVYRINTSTAVQTLDFPGNYTGLVYISSAPPPCYPNCDNSTTPPVLNVQDFSCFLNRFAGGDTYANCDGSTIDPVLNVQDFSCFLNRFASGCT